MGILDDKVKSEIKAILLALPKVVTLKYFGQEVECRFCKETRELVQELGALTDKVKVELFDLLSDKVEAEKLGIARIPAIAVSDEQDRRIRFYGIPSGYEFTSLIEAIKLVATGHSPLGPETRSFLATLERDVHLQVFVTPTCPYCPGSVVLAHHLAYLSPMVLADMVEATEFPQLAQKYNVLGVPRTVINEVGFLEGAAPEKMLVEKIRETLGGLIVPTPGSVRV